MQYASNGDPPYAYEWSVGCSYTNIFGAYVENLQTFGVFTTTPIKCKHVAMRVMNTYIHICMHTIVQLLLMSLIFNLKSIN